MEPLLSVLKEKIDKRSLRSVARELKIPAPTLSRLLNGRRPFTAAMTKRLIEATAKDAGERRRLLEVAFVRPEGKARKPTRYRKLSADELRQLENWHFMVVADALGVRPRSIGKISEICGLSVREVEHCLNRMKRMGLVKYRVGQGFEMKDPHLSTLQAEGTREWADLQWGMVDRLRKLHPMADPSRSVLRGIVFRTPPENLAAIRSRIQTFVEDLADEFAEVHSRNMVRMNIQFGPLV